MPTESECRTGVWLVRSLETDTQTAALGYKADATKTDKVKYPKYAACKQVAGKGWCSAWGFCRSKPCQTIKR